MQIVNLILGLLAVAGVAILKLFPEFFLPSYLKRKGENRATIEDLGKIKEIETRFSRELEQLRSDLERRTHVSAAQFTVEFGTYQEIWRSLVEVRRDISDLAFPADAAAKVKQLQKLEEDYNSLSKLVEQKRPFYPTEIWDEMKSLLLVFRDVAYELQLPDDSKGHKEFSEKEKARFDKIAKGTDAVCEAIRLRLTSLVAK